MKDYINGNRFADLAHFVISPNHFSYGILKKDGITIISFPTPTFLYRITRKICEIIGIWFFHDERPLEFEEVIKETQK